MMCGSGPISESGSESREEAVEVRGRAREASKRKKRWWFIIWYQSVVTYPSRVVGGGSVGVRVATGYLARMFVGNRDRVRV